MVSIKEVETLRDLKRFVRFPERLYADNPCWVPPLLMDELNTLRRDKNPAFEFCEAKYWLAYKDGEPVGRVAGIINHRYFERWGKKHARFGWIDFVDDEEVSRALLETVETWARDKGMTGVHGPLGFCDLDKEGMLVEGFDELGTMVTIYNHAYYPAHLEKLGYRKDADWVEFELKVPEKIPESIERVNQILQKKGKLRIIKAKKARELRPYAKGVFELVNSAYANLYGVVPLSEKQIEAFIKQYFSFLSPDYALIVLDERGEMAAFAVAIPSLSKALQRSRGKLFPFGFLHLLRALRKNDRLDLYLIAVRPDLQLKGVNALLMTEITRAAIKNGVVKAESNPELEENGKVQALWKHYEGRQHKRRRVYLKDLGERKSG
ncbi:MAG: GNAT family N-acetyltransferase [Bacteroidota bacterium]